MGPRLRRIAAVLALLALAAAARAGGDATSAVLLVDPTYPDGVRVANHYVAARGIPASNVLFLAPFDAAADWPNTHARNVRAVLAELAARGIEDHVDTVILAPTSRYYLAAGVTVPDECAKVSRFALPSAYTMAHLAADLEAGVPSTEPNRFFSTLPDATGFSHATAWLDGAPSQDPLARRYYVGAMLGWTGSLGNTVPEILGMIDRSVAVDGTAPAGTFYFVQTGDPARSGPRHDFYPATAAAIEARGGSAEHLLGVLPAGEHDCLGIMTGYANLNFDGSDLAILPGAFCDHLTSWAATFDLEIQTKMTEWIRRGASGTVGAVQEPCNYPGKFPRPELHLYYFQGATLGEAYFRSAEYVPFQMLLLGDPLTRPFAPIPTVEVPGFPSAPVEGSLTLSPVAASARPGGSLARLDLLVDGAVHSSVAPGGSFTLDTLGLYDGWHEVRVLAHDDSALATTGSWTGGIEVANAGRAATLAVAPPAGDLATTFVLDAGGSGAGVREVRVLAHGRVVAAAAGATARLEVRGDALGAGPVPLVAEALFLDGTTARSRPVAIEVAAEGGPAPAPPVAFGFAARVRPGGLALVELPTSSAGGLASATFTVVAAPARAAVLDGAVGPFRILDVDPEATGEDALTFRVETAEGSAEATVALLYDPAPAPPPPPIPELALVAGSIRDKTKAGRDKVKLAWTLPAPVELDPGAASLRVEVGAAGADPLVLEIAAGDPGWRERKGRWRYKAAKALRPPKVKVRFDPAAGQFRLAVKKAELPAAAANPVRVRVETGGDPAEIEADWTPGKPGRFAWP